MLVARGLGDQVAPGSEPSYAALATSADKQGGCVDLTLTQGMVLTLAARAVCVEAGQSRMGQEAPRKPHTKLFDDRLVLEPRSNFRCFPACMCVRCKQLVASKRNARKQGTKKPKGKSEDEKALAIAKAREYAFKATTYVSKEAA